MFGDAERTLEAVSSPDPPGILPQPDAASISAAIANLDHRSDMTLT